MMVCTLHPHSLPTPARPVHRTMVQGLIGREPALSPPRVTTVRRLPYLYTLCAGYVESFLELLLKQVSEIFFHLTKIQVSSIPSSISSGERCLI